MRSICAWTTRKIVDSEEVKSGVVIDFDAKDQAVGIEILRVKRRVLLANFKQLLFEVA
jgi:uncharacterized protein YuzE